MWVWRETREKWLGISALGVLILIGIVNYKFPVIPWLDGGEIAVLLRADATGSVINDLLVGLFSAYIFYLLVELWPRHRDASHTQETLNLVVAAFVDAYELPTTFGHEKPITSVSLSVLDIDNVQKHAEEVLLRPEMFKLTSAMRTAHSRYSDVQHALSMAVSLSPEHARDWLVLTDKMRLLVDEYNSFPRSPFEDNPLGQPTEDQKQDIALMKAHEKYLETMKYVPGSLQLRVMEVLEATVKWLERQHPEKRRV